jgi:hypothetical protein
VGWRRCDGVDLGDLVAQQPARQVEVMDAHIDQDAAADRYITEAGRWYAFVTVQRLE